jgi:hypothetical protein
LPQTLGVELAFERVNASFQPAMHNVLKYCNSSRRCVLRRTLF